MKKGKLFFALALTAGASTLFFAFGPGNNATPDPRLDVIEVSDNANNKSARFVLSNLPDLTAAGTYATTEPQPCYLVFVDTGDGFYFKDTIAGNVGQCTLAYVHHYADASRTYYPLAELTPAYGDTDDPIGYARNTSGAMPSPPATSFKPSAGSSISNATPFNGWATIGASRLVCPGDPITYIVTYQNSECPDAVHGEVFLRFDTTILNFRGVKSYFSEAVTPGVEDANTTGVVRWTYLNLRQGEQRNLFFEFETDSNAIVDKQLDPVPALTFTHGNDSREESSPCYNGSTAEIPHYASSAVAYAHDPNRKTADLKRICATDEYITYTITFQNEGAAPATKVMVEDELDQIFGAEMPQYMQSSHPDNITVLPYTVNSRRLAFSFEHKGQHAFQLRGTGEKTHGIDFQDDATIGWVKFRIKLPPFTPARHCDILPNRAKITFNCNPPMWTTLQTTPFQCANCADCVTILDTIIPLTSAVSIGGNPPGLFPLNDGLASQLQDTYTNFRWYPASGSESPTALDPHMFSLQNTTYTLIATDPAHCRKAILHFPIKFSICSSLAIQVDPLGLQPTPCLGTKSGYINAWVTGGSGGNLLWHTCATTEGNDTFRLTNTAGGRALPPGTYYLGVTDQTSHCTAERWVTIPEPTALTVDDDPADCAAVLKVSGGQPPYSYAWDIVPAGSAAPAEGGARINDLSSVKAASVTVTDSKGCTGTLTIRPRDCGGSASQGGGLWKIVLGVIALVLAAFGGWRYVLRKKV